MNSLSGASPVAEGNRADRVGSPETLLPSHPDGTKAQPLSHPHPSRWPAEGIVPAQSIEALPGIEEAVNRDNRQTFFLLTGLALVLAGLVWWWDPADWHVPFCSFYRLTGWYCPGCGGLRAAHSLLHGRWADAWAYHPLLVLLAPWAGYGLLLWGLSVFWPKRRWPGRWLYGPWTLVLVGLVALAFGILRNLPWEPFCHWKPGP